MTQPNQWGGQGDFNSYQQAGNWNSGNSTNPSGSWSGQNSWSGQSSVPNQNANNWNQNWGNNQAPNTIGGANAFPVNQALNPDGSNAAQSDATNKIDPELAEFDSQFKTWEGQFAKWKDENKDHPDKTALAKYEEQWTKWRDDLLARRQEIISSKKNPSTSDSGPSVPINSGLGSQTQWGASGGSNQPQGSNSWNQGPNWSQGPNQANNSWDPNQGNPPNWANNNASQAPNPTVYGANPGQNMPVQNQNWNQSSQNTNQGHPGWQGPNHQFQNFGVNQNPTGPNWGPNQTQNFPTNQVPNGPNQNWVPNQTQQGGTNQGSNWGPNQNWNSHQPSNIIPGSSNDSQNIIGNVPPPQRQPPNQSGQMNNWVSNGPHSKIDSNQGQAPMMPGLGAPPNGPNQVNHSMRPNQGPPHMGPQGVHPMGPNQGHPSMGLNQGHPSMGLNQGPPSMGLNQGPPSMAFNQGPPPMGPNQGPPPMGPNQGPTLMGPSQGQPPIGPNQGPPPMGHTQAPSPMGPNQHNSAIPNLGHNMSEPYGRSNQGAPNMVPHPNISNVGPSQMGQYVPGQTKGPNNAPYVPSMGVNDSSQSSGLESHDNSQNKDSEIKSFLPNEVKDMGFNSQSFGTRSMNQGLGMGPRGPTQGLGLGPRGPIQGPGIGPRGPVIGPDMGPRGTIQGPGMGPRGPNQGPGMGPRGPNQGPGMGPRGPNQGMGPRGPNQGPGMGPRGPNQGRGMGPRGPNQGRGMGPRGPNQGPGMGPRGPNQGPGMGPRGLNQGPGMGPRGPNQGPRMGFQAQHWNSSNQGQQWQANDCNPGKNWGAVNNANPENEKLVENSNFQDSRSFRGRGHSRKSSRFDANPNEAPPSDVNINMSWKTGNQNWTGSERETKVFSPSFETLNAQSNKGDSLATLKLQKSEALEVSGGIPGLDIPADDEIKEQKTNLSVKKNSPAKPMKTEEEKQPELKFGDNRLNIGPIGVAQKLNNWKPSGDWYDDDDPDNQDGNKMGTNDDNFGNKKRSAQLPDINPAMNKVPRMSAPQGPRGGMQGPRPLMSIGTFDPMPPFSGGPRSPIGRGGPRSPIGRGRPRSPIGRGGPRGTIGMGGPRGHPRMGGSRGPIGMDGPRGPSRMDGPRGHPRMGGPRGPPGMGGPRGPLGPRSSFRGGPPFGGPPMMGRGGRGIRGRGRGSPFFEVGPLERGSPPSSHYSDNFYDLGVSEGVQPIITKVVEYGHKGQQSPIQVSSPITPSSENLMEENQSIVSQCDTSPPSSLVTPNKVSIEDLLEIPGRFMRPPKLVIILRGLPGSGKTTIAKMIKEKEILNGGSAARILCLDDYFMVESEKLVIDEETGRKIKTKVMEYEYEPEFEDNYRKALVKSFKKQIDEKFFPFIIIDCVNGLNENYKEMCDYCTKKDFEFYIGEIEVDVQTCFQRNTRKRSLIDLQKMALKWERTPSSYTCVDLTSLIQDANIEEVQMEDSEPVTTEKPPEDVLVIEPTTNYSDEEDSEATTFKVINELMKSKWDTDQSQEEKLDKLDGVRAAKKKNTDGEPQSIDDWLQLSENFTEGKAKPGKKTVRWADIEERREQLSARHRGFVLGQTNWNRMTDPSLGSNALVQVRYIEPRPNKEKTPVP